jgi:tetratricopeptide (TPR) repeat protein
MKIVRFMYKHKVINLMKYFHIIFFLISLTSCSEEYFYNKHLHDTYDDYENKLKHFTEAIKISPGNADAYYGRGKILAGLGQYEEALADYDRAVELKPDFAEVYLSRGYLKRNYWKYLDNTIFRQALDDADKLIELDYKKYDAYLLRADIKEGSKDYNGALEDYSTAIKIMPQGGWAYYHRGSIRFHHFNDAEGSLEDLSKAKKIFKEIHDDSGYEMADDLIDFIKEMEFSDKLLEFINKFE